MDRQRSPRAGFSSPPDRAHQPPVFLATFVSVLLLASASPLVATTVVAPTFAQLMSSAERVVVAEVIEVESRQVVAAEGPTIVTEVTVRIDRTLKGTPQSVTVLELAGGTVGDVTLEIAGIPRFRIGDRDVLFIKGGARSISPLVGFMYGRFRVTADPATGTDYVSTYNFAPFAVDELGVMAADVRPGSRPVPLADFERRIVQAVRAQRPQ